MEKEFMVDEIKVICHVCEQEVPGKGVFTYDGPKMAHTSKHEHNGKTCEGTGYINPVV